ncbi:hypothetical protein [Paraburkholderia acidipaludis]|uniref:hypothetical protein n=1 Tax=Paraburkholderia acidipaludis TaxID=660537 RepID=UPI00048663E6|nr:hypothetical protein [Paraburkholderia acidipaludis]
MGSTAINGGTSAATDLHVQQDTPVTVTPDRARSGLVRSNSVPASFGGLERMQNRPAGGAQSAPPSRRASLGALVAPLHGAAPSAPASPLLSPSSSHDDIADLDDDTLDPLERTQAREIANMLFAAITGLATQTMHGGRLAANPVGMNTRSLEEMEAGLRTAGDVLPGLYNLLLASSDDSERFSEMPGVSGNGTPAHGGTASPASTRPATPAQTSAQTPAPVQTPQPAPQGALVEEHRQVPPVESGRESPASSVGAHGMEFDAIPLVPVPRRPSVSSLPARLYPLETESDDVADTPASIAEPPARTPSPALTADTASSGSSAHTPPPTVHVPPPPPHVPPPLAHVPPPPAHTPPAPPPAPHPAAAPTAAAGALPPLPTNIDGALERWAKNAIKVVGHRAFSVGVATGIREALNYGVEALVQSTHASDEVKTGVAATMMGVVILANIGSAAYRIHRGDSRWSYAGNAAQAASLTAALIGALKAGTLKDQVSSLAKVGGYSAVRDLMTMIVPLKDNLHPNPDPIVTQMINSAFYTVNQFLVNSAQSFHGISGAGIYDGLHGNQTLTEKERSSFIKDSAKGMAVYVAANTAGEIVDSIMPRMIQYRLQHGTFDGMSNLELNLGIGEPDSLSSTMLDAVVPRLSLFDTVYAGTSALNTRTNTPGIGEQGASYLDNFTSALMIATLCIPYAMTGARKTSNAVRAMLDSLRDGQV